MREETKQVPVTQNSLEDTRYTIAPKVNHESKTGEETSHLFSKCDLEMETYGIHQEFVEG